MPFIHIRKDDIMKELEREYSTECELTDEELGRCISQCHENFLNSENTEAANEWAWAMTMFLSEQRRRMDLMLKEVYGERDNPWGYWQVRLCYGCD